MRDRLLLWMWKVKHFKSNSLEFKTKILFSIAIQLS